MKPKPLLESAVQKSIQQYLSLHPDVVIHWRQNNGKVAAKGGYFAGAGVPGIADIGGLLKDGRYLAIEVKRPGVKRSGEYRHVPSEAQRAFLSLVEDNDGVACVARGIEDVERCLNALKRGSTWSWKAMEKKSK